MFYEVGASFIERGKTEREREREGQKEEKKLHPSQILDINLVFPLEGSNKYRAIPTKAFSDEWGRVREHYFSSDQESESQSGTISFLKEEVVLKGNVETQE